MDPAGPTKYKSFISKSIENTNKFIMKVEEVAIPLLTTAIFAGGALFLASKVVSLLPFAGIPNVLSRYRKSR